MRWPATPCHVSNLSLKGPILAALLLGMLIPIHSTLVPLFIMLNQIQLLDTYWAMILPYFSFEFSIAVFLLYAFMSGLPKEMEEAATIDGSGYWGIFIRIMFPLSMPTLSTVAVIAFLRYWNEFAFALVFINDSNLKTLPLSSVRVFRWLFNQLQLDFSGHGGVSSTGDRFVPIDARAHYERNGCRRGKRVIPGHPICAKLYYIRR